MKRIWCMVLALTVMISLFGMAACQNGESDQTEISITLESTEFDLSSKDNFKLQIELNGKKFKMLKRKTGEDSSSVVTGSNYIFDASTGEMQILNVYLQTLPLGENIFIVINEEDRAKEFSIQLVQENLTAFDPDPDREYIYGSGTDIQYSVDFQDVAITNIKQGGTILSTNCYTFADNKLTLKSAYLDSLMGVTDFSVNLENNQVHKFTIRSNMVFQSNFDDVTAAGEWYFNLRTAEIVDQGIDGKSFRMAGNGGSVLLLGREFLFAEFDPASTYRLTFKLRNEWQNPEKPCGGLFGFNTDDYGKSQYFAYDYVNHKITKGEGEVQILDERTVQITIEFVPFGETYTECWAGYDPENADEDIFDLLLDDIYLYKIVE